MSLENILSFILTKLYLTQFYYGWELTKALNNPTCRIILEELRLEWSGYPAGGDIAARDADTAVKLKEKKKKRRKEKKEKRLTLETVIK